LYVLNIEIPDDIGDMVKQRAHAQGISPDRYVAPFCKALASEQPEAGPFETGYGMWAKYGPAPSAGEIDENRREMFRNFAKDF
jgi:hypothetical protein